MSYTLQSYKYIFSITGSQDWAWKYILSLICLTKMDFSEQYHIEGKVRDVVRSPFWAKHINIVCLSISMINKRWRQWCQYNATKSVIIYLYHTCSLIIDIIVCKNQKKIYKSLIIPPIPGIKPRMGPVSQDH